MNAGTQQFNAGPLAFRMDGDTGFVRDIRFHGYEVLRGIYPAVRDTDWATLRPEAQPVEFLATANGVCVRLAARVAAADLAWTANIEAHESGKLVYRWSGEAQRELLTNRTGLCVLHPAEIAGAPCVIEHSDGRCEAGWFPREISPHQPFRDIRAIAYVVGRAEIAVRMEGEIFEMEDQRNWTDASFKTYCRPLDWLRPYRLAARESITHAVTLELRGEPKPTAAAEIPKPPAASRWPRIGFTLPGPIPAALRKRLSALRPGHVRVEANPGTLHHTLEWARQEAQFLNCTLVAAIRAVDGKPPNRGAFPAQCEVHLFDSSGNTVTEQTLRAWRDAGFEQIATGTLHNFTELNRERPPITGANTRTVFGINAQCHASDDDSILQTLTQHAAVARAAHCIGGGRPVAVGPISFGRSADSVDPRLSAELGARWLHGSLAQLAAAGCVESATYFHAHGPAGFLCEDGTTSVEKLLLAIAGRDKLPE
jgi:hypothetical protein